MLLFVLSISFSISSRQLFFFLHWVVSRSFSRNPKNEGKHVLNIDISIFDFDSVWTRPISSCTFDWGPISLRTWRSLLVTPPHNFQSYGVLRQLSPRLCTIYAPFAQDYVLQPPCIVFVNVWRHGVVTHTYPARRIMSVGEKRACR